ncbi:MAG: hypothetical protein ACKOEX_00350, partial [Planctomycetia bacterium]
NVYQHGLGQLGHTAQFEDRPMHLALPRRHAPAATGVRAIGVGGLRDPLREKFAAELAAASQRIPPDPNLVTLAADLADAEKPLADDPGLVRLRADVAASSGQLANKRLTAVQDLAWALINSPAFFFNH